ncbi:hypothetical protein OM427_23975 [Halomonas sp. 18H]|nr:hypothetical protein [Halomonas sp. 18H]MCW4152579.1 hypothetical protein [Halomonas sp. 18H]
MMGGYGKVLGVIGCLMLAGCQTTPNRMPEAEPLPAAACQWPVTEQTGLVQVVGALERRGFLVRDTDTDIGLVSAERAQRTFYPNAMPPRPRLGGFLFGGSGGHLSSGIGFGIGFGGGGGHDEATRIERVSVQVGERQVTLSRDIRLHDWRGRQVQSRTASDEGFCQMFRDTLVSREVTP